MRSEWSDGEIVKALRKMSKESAEKVVYERVWFNIEQRLSPLGKTRRHSYVWRPWLHPVRWALAACLCLFLAAGFYYRSLLDQADLAFFLESISNPVEEVAVNDEVVPVPVLLTDNASFSNVETYLPENEDWSQPLLGDGAGIP